MRIVTENQQNIHRKPTEYSQKTNIILTENSQNSHRKLAGCTQNTHILFTENHHNLMENPYNVNNKHRIFTENTKYQ